MKNEEGGGQKQKQWRPRVGPGGLGGPEGGPEGGAWKRRAKQKWGSGGGAVHQRSRPVTSASENKKMKK